MHFPNPSRCFQYLSHHITSIYSIKNLFPFPYSFTFVTSGNWQVLPSPSTPSMVGHSLILVAVLPCSVKSGEQKKKKKLQRNRGEGRKKKRTYSYMGDALFGAGQEASTPARIFELPSNSSNLVWNFFKSEKHWDFFRKSGLVFFRSGFYLALFFFQIKPAFFFSLTETGLGFNNLGILLLFFGFVFLRCFLLCGGPICIEKILDLQRSSELHQRSFFILNLEVILDFL